MAYLFLVSIKMQITSHYPSGTKYVHRNEKKGKAYQIRNHFFPSSIKSFLLRNFSAICKRIRRFNDTLQMPNKFWYIESLYCFMLLHKTNFNTLNERSGIPDCISKLYLQFRLQKLKYFPKNSENFKSCKLLLIFKIDFINVARLDIWPNVRPYVQHST